jgi:predicted transcriptional regulator
MPGKGEGMVKLQIGNSFISIVQKLFDEMTIAIMVMCRQLDETAYHKHKLRYNGAGVHQAACCLPT